MVKKYLTWYLVLAMCMLMVPRVEAAFVPSEALPQVLADRSADLEKIRQVLETKMIEQRLADLGYSVDEIRTRISQLSDDQIHSFAQRLDDLRTGQDGAGVIIVLLVVIIVILVALQVTGKKIIVTQ